MRASQTRRCRGRLWASSTTPKHTLLACAHGLSRIKALTLVWEFHSLCISRQGVKGGGGGYLGGTTSAPREQCHGVNGDGSADCLVDLSPWKWACGTRFCVPTDVIVFFIIIILRLVRKSAPAKLLPFPPTCRMREECLPPRSLPCSLPRTPRCCGDESKLSRATCALDPARPRTSNKVVARTERCADDSVVVRENSDKIDVGPDGSLSARGPAWLVANPRWRNKGRRSVV